MNNREIEFKTFESTGKTNKIKETMKIILFWVGAVVLIVFKLILALITFNITIKLLMLILAVIIKAVF